VGVEDVESLWTSDAFSEDVRSDENQALDLGFSGVPTFVLDGKFVVSGAQGVATFTNALERAWNRRHSVSAGT
jgi:predicted DsbA family dithiol-disulfide isomerase